MDNTSVMMIRIKDNHRIFLVKWGHPSYSISCFHYKKEERLLGYNGFARVGFGCPDLMSGNSICRTLPPTHLRLKLNVAARVLLKIRNAYSSMVFIQLFKSQAQTRLRVCLLVHLIPLNQNIFIFCWNERRGSTPWRMTNQWPALKSRVGRRICRGSPTKVKSHSIDYTL